MEDYVNSHKPNVKLNKGQPFEPILALMFMLPEQNFDLLPKVVADKLMDQEGILRKPVDYFPKKFKLDKF